MLLCLDTVRSNGHIQLCCEQWVERRAAFLLGMMLMKFITLAGIPPDCSGGNPSVEFHFAVGSPPTSRILFS
jgi:hypothetical protein